MAPFGSSAQIRQTVRSRLEQELPTDAEFDAFVLDHYRAVFKRFGSGMERVAKTNLLLSAIEPASVLATLSIAVNRPFSESECGAAELSAEPANRTSRLWICASLLAFAAGASMVLFQACKPALSQPTKILPGPPLGMVCFSGGPVTLQTDEGIRRVDVRPFCIDMTLVPQQRYLECVKHGACTKADSTNYWGKDDQDYTAIYSSLCNARLAGRSNHPMNCVDYQQAAAYCQYDGNKRLPTEAEWVIAAGGQFGWPYPWGSEPPTPERLNACDARCVTWALQHGLRWKIQDLSKSNIIAVPHEGIDSERLFDGDDGWESTSEVRSKPPNIYGLFDMAGNLRQWTTDMVKHRKDGRMEEWPVLKGGSWSELRPAHVSIPWRAPAPPTLRAEINGFRCVVSR